MSAARPIGDVILDVKDISLRFGGVKALSGISFDVREHEVRAIIGPNRARNTAILNSKNGDKQPQETHNTYGDRNFHQNNSPQISQK